MSGSAEGIDEFGDLFKKIEKLEVTLLHLFEHYINADDEHAWALLTERHPNLVQGTAEEDTRKLVHRITGPHENGKYRCSCGQSMGRMQGLHPTPCPQCGAPP